MIHHPRLCGRGVCLTISGREGVSDVVRKNTSTTSGGRRRGSLGSITCGPGLDLRGNFLGLDFVRPEDLIVFNGLTIHQTASYRFPDIAPMGTHSLPCVK